MATKKDNSKRKEKKKDSKKIKTKKEQKNKKEKKTSTTKNKDKKIESKKLKLSNKIKRISRKAKERIPKIKNEKAEKENIEEAILKTAPKKEKRVWPKEEQKEKTTKETSAQREERLNTRNSSPGITIQSSSQKNNPSIIIPNTKNENTSLEDTVENSDTRISRSGITSEITYDKIQNLTQKFLEGKLSQNEYRTLWNYHQLFNSEKAFLDEYVKNLNPNQKEILQRTQYLMRTTPLSPIQYSRRTEAPIIYQRNSESRINIRDYVSSRAKINDSAEALRQTRKRDDSIVRDVEKPLNKDYIPKNK